MTSGNTSFSLADYLGGRAAEPFLPWVLSLIWSTLFSIWAGLKMSFLPLLVKVQSYIS